MDKKEFDAVAKRMNEVGFTPEMATADKAVFDEFLRGEAVMIVEDRPDGDELHMVQRSLIPELCELGARRRNAHS